MKHIQQWRRSSAVQGVAATSAVRYGAKVSVFVRLILLTQFLVPADLGRFGLSMLAVAIGEVFTETGINLVLLRHPDALRKYLDTAWAVSLTRGVLIAAALALLSPYMAAVYHDSALQSSLLLAALIPLVRGAINPAIVTYQQRLQFGAESLLRTTLQSIDVVIGLLAAYLWRSGDGLIVGVLASALTETVLSFLLFSLRPRLRWPKLALVRSLYAQTKYIIGNGILHYLTENLDDLLIGRLFGTSLLGVYQTSYALASSITNDVGSVVGQILYPIYAQRQRRQMGVATLWRSSSLAMAVWFGGASVGVFALAPPLLPLLLGSEWHSIVPVVQLLFLAGVLKSYVTAWNPLAILSEQLHRFVWLNAVHMIIMVGGILALQPYTVVGAGTAVLLASAGIFVPALLLVRSAVRSLDKGAYARTL